MAPPNAIDKSGDTIRCYIKGLKAATTSIQFERVFVLEGGDNDFKAGMIPTNLFSASLESFHTLCCGESMKKLFRSANDYQRIAVEHWNPFINDVTDSNYMGCSPMGEESSRKAGAHALNFCIKYGMIQETASGGWENSSDFESKMAIVIGDVKSADNVEKLVRDLTTKPLTMRDNNATAECFRKAL